MSPGSPATLNTRSTDSLVTLDLLSATNDQNDPLVRGAASAQGDDFDSQEVYSLWEMAKTRQFIVLYIMNTFSIMAGFFAINNFKTYG